MNLDWWPKYVAKHPDPDLVITARGMLTREGALRDARILWGDLGTISSTDDYPKLVWCIGQFDRTVGRGKTWEIALQRSKAKKAKLEARELARMKEEAASVG